MSRVPLPDCSFGINASRYVFATGAAAAGISGGSLLCLMRVLYPNAHYCCAIYSLGHNVRFAYAYIPFLTLMPALIWGMVALAQTFRGHSITDRSILMAAPMYVAVWSFMGNWAEARIIVPFAMGLLPAVSTAMARFLMLSTASESPN